MESPAQDQLSGIVTDFERRLSDLRDAQQQLVRQLETDKVVLETQMKERTAQLEQQRAEIAAERRDVQAQRAELDRVWAAVGKLNEVMAQGPVKFELKADESSRDAAPEPADVEGDDPASSDDHQRAVDHDGWSVRYAA